MSTSNQNSAAVIGHVLNTIDNEPGTILNKDQQNDFLDDFTSTYKCTYQSSIYANTWHDAKTLRAALIGIVKYRTRTGLDIRPGKTALDELFERGSEVLDEKYVESVRRAAKATVLNRWDEADGDKSDSNSDDQHQEDWAIRTWIEPSSGSDEDYQPNKKKARGARKPRKAAPKAAHTAAPVFNASNLHTASRSLKNSETSMDRSISPLTTTKPTPMAPKRGFSKISFDSDGSDLIEIEDDTDADADGEEESDNDTDGGPSIGSKRRKVKPHAPLIDHSTKQRPEAASPTQNAIETSVDPQENLLNAKEQTGSRIEMGQSPAETPTIVDPRLAESAKPQDNMPAEEDLGDQIERLNKTIRDAVMTYLAKISPGKRADIVIRPSPELDVLYRQVFGTRKWRSKASELQIHRALPTIDILRSLIAAFLFKSVFTHHGNLPWLKATYPFVGFLHPEDGSYSLDTESQKAYLTLKEELSARYPGFEQHIRSSLTDILINSAKAGEAILKPAAKDLANECLLTLNGHLSLLTRANITINGSVKLQEELERICEQAVRIHCRLMLSMKQVEVLWFDPGADFDEDDMEVETSWKGDGDRVAFTIFPGIDWMDKEDQRSVPPIVGVW